MTSDFQTAVTCNLCWELFATGIRDPLVLPKCGHTFCRLCLCKLKSKGPWHCPLCRYPYRRTSVSELPVNFVALSVTSTLKEKHSDRKIQAEPTTTGLFTSSLNGLLHHPEAPERLQFSSIFKSGLSFEEQRYKEQTKRDSSIVVKKSAFTSPNNGRFFFAKDDTSGSASSSASASALSLFSFGQTKSTPGSVFPAACVRDKKIQAEPTTTGLFTSSLNGLLHHPEAPGRLQFSSIFKSGLSFEEQRYKEQTKRDSSIVVKKSAFTSPNNGRFFFAKDDTSGSASSSASASALSLFSFGQTKSTPGSVFPAACVRDKVTLAKLESSVTKNTFDHPPFFELPVNKPTVSSGRSNGCVWHTKNLSKGFVFASGLTPSAPKADPRDRSQNPILLKCNESNSASRSLPNDININTVVNKLGLLTISKTSTSESSGMHNLTSVVKESNTEIVLTHNISSPLETPVTNMVSTNNTFSKASAPEESFNFFRISHLDLPLTNVTTLQMLRSEINYHQKILSKEFGLTNVSASDSSTPTNSPSLEASPPRQTSTPSDSSSKTAAANNPISFTDQQRNNSLKVIPMNRSNSNGHSFRFTLMDPRMAILTIFQELNNETGYYEEITSKGFLGKEPSVHRFRKTARRRGKCQESKSAQKNQDLQCQSSSTPFRGLGARPKVFA
ncbi:uncharacterized protein LOC134765715 [Penaeus indicus]|uniref:uncharacterized protein LOC134765715 n=1 Tax=Penaeus indicus TaxID=29960 RepID=UPI00300CD221